MLREVQKLLPREQLLYFADAANAPYGEKSPETVRDLVLHHAARLLGKSKALVLACNTATAVAAEALRRRYPDRIVVGMEPALRPAVLAHPNGTVLVLATAATLHEEKFKLLAERYGENATVIPLAAPRIVTLVEAGRASSPEMLAYLWELLAPYRERKIAAVVLGCTHFPLAARAIRAAVGECVPLYDGAGGTARELARRLAGERLLAPPTARGGVCLCSSDAARLPLYRALLADFG